MRRRRRRGRALVGPDRGPRTGLWLQRRHTGPAAGTGIRGRCGGPAAWMRGWYGRSRAGRRVLWSSGRRVTAIARGGTLPVRGIPIVLRMRAGHRPRGRARPGSRFGRLLGSAQLRWRFPEGIAIGIARVAGHLRLRSGRRRHPLPRCAGGPPASWTVGLSTGLLPMSGGFIVAHHASCIARTPACRLSPVSCRTLRRRCCAQRTVRCGRRVVSGRAPAPRTDQECRCAHPLHLPCDTRAGHLPRSAGG